MPTLLLWPWDLLLWDLSLGMLVYLLHNAKTHRGSLKQKGEGVRGRKEKQLAAQPQIPRLGPFQCMETLALFRSSVERAVHCYHQLESVGNWRGSAHPGPTDPVDLVCVTFS